MLSFTGFDKVTLDCHFMAIDPERVGLKNIEVPVVCDFGDNVLDYMTKGGRLRTLAREAVCDSDESDIDANFSDSKEDDSDEDSIATSSSDECVLDEPVQNDYSGTIPPKFIAFLTS